MLETFPVNQMHFMLLRSNQLSSILVNQKRRAMCRVVLRERSANKQHSDSTSEREFAHSCCTTKATLLIGMYVHTSAMLSYES
jgi:hypothetical protein